MRTVAIFSGGDWCDASVDHINIDDSFDLALALLEYKEWLRLKVHVKPRLHEYLTFTEWLIQNKGAQESDLVEEFWEIQ
jgi:hypothetical protein